MKFNTVDVIFRISSNKKGTGVDATRVGELVRCKDCIHYNAGFECLVEGYGIEREPDWYCADGKREGNT